MNETELTIMLCPTCGAKNDDNSKFCLSCGGALNQAIAETPAEAPAAAAANHAVPPATQEPFPQYAPPAAPPAKAKKGGKGCIIAIIVVLVLAIAGVAVFFLVIKKGADIIDDVINDITSTTTFTEQNSQQDTDTTTVNSENTTTAGQPSQQEIFDILSNSDLDGWDGNWNNLTAEQKQAIENYYEALGQGIYFGENGFTFEEDGETVQLGGQWPSSPLLKDVPKPAFGSIFSSSVADDEVVVLYSGWTPEQLAEYVGMVKAAGFTKNAGETNIMGISSYEADNGSIRIVVGNAMGFFTITAEKM